MTGGPLISLYLFTLAFFLGLDVIRRVPPTLQVALATAMGTAAAIVVLVALPVGGGKGTAWTAGLGVAAVALGTAGVSGGLLRLRGMVRAKWEKEARP